MSILVYFDEHTFKITNLTRPDSLTGRDRERSWGGTLSEEASTRGRSVAHPGRYAEKLSKPD